MLRYSSVYPALEKLEAYGLVDSAMSGAKPFSRLEVARMVGEAMEAWQEAKPKKKISGFAEKELIPSLLVSTTAIWFLEAGRFYCVCRSMDVDVSLLAVLFVSTSSALLTAIPFTPCMGAAISTWSLFWITRCRPISRPSARASVWFARSSHALKISSGDHPAT